MLRSWTLGMTVLLTAAPVIAQDRDVDYPTYEPGPAVRNGYTAEELLDAEIFGKDGKQIGDVDDLVIGPDGQLRRLVVSVDENFLGFGGRRLAVGWSDVQMGPKRDGETRRITVPITKENVEKYGLFEHRKKAISGGPREWRATELLGDYVSLKDIEDYGSVTDLMFDRQGRLRAIAASPEIDSPVVRFYAPYSGDDEGWDPGDDYYVLPYTEAEVEKLLPAPAS